MSNLQNTLEQKSSNDLIALKEKYPFVALFHVVAAKKAIEENHFQADQLISSAALRVPSRSQLQDYLNVSREFRNETQFERVLMAPFREQSRFKPSLTETTERGESNQQRETVEEPVQEFLEPVGEIADEPQIEDVIDDSFEVEIYEREVTFQEEVIAQDVISEDDLAALAEDDTERLPQELIQENLVDEIRIDEPQVEQANVEELLPLAGIAAGAAKILSNSTETVEDEQETVDDSFEVEIYEREENIEEQEEVLEPENKAAVLPYHEELDIEEELEDEHFFAAEEVLDRDEAKLERKPSLYDEIAHDDVDEIGEELILEEEEKKVSSATIEDIEEGTDENDSVYKRVVEILKKDQETENQSITSEPIKLPEEAQEEVEEETVEEFLERNNELEEGVEDKYDAELINLYQEAAYSAELQQEIGQLKEEDVEVSTNSQQKEDFSFMGWLDSFSANQDAPKQETKQVTSSFKDQEIAYEYRDSDEDLNDETSLLVQERAKRSMESNPSLHTETLAMIFQMQEKYDKAIEVYKSLALKNPEKSSYFASQIKNLKEKLN